MKRSVSVQIAGQRYQLRSDAPDETVREIASYVDGRIREVQRQTRAVDTQALAVLTALQVAEELFRERAALTAARAELAEARKALAEERRSVGEARKALAELKRRVREKSTSLLQFLEREARV
jgi:cell division protein ZapA